MVISHALSRRPVFSSSAMTYAMGPAARAKNATYT